MRIASLLPLAALCASATGQDLLVSSWNTDAVLRYDASTGASLGFLIPPGFLGLSRPHSAVFGPDGAVYVTSFGTNEVLRVVPGAALGGVFVAAGAGGLSGPTDAFFGPDGNLYVASRGASPGIKRYDATGAFVDQFIAGGNGLVGTETGNFGPDGHFYLASGPGNLVNRYHGQTGDFLDTFVTPGLGGLVDPHDLAWGPCGDLYVTSFGNGTVKRYDRQGNYLEDFAAGIPGAHGLDFRPDGLLYVASFSTSSVHRRDAVSGAPVDVFVPSGSGGLSGAASLTFQRADTLDISGVDNLFRVFGTEPGELVYFLTGACEGTRGFASCPQPSVIGIHRVLLMGAAAADAGGVATLAYSPPPTLSGQTLFMQAFAPATCRSSEVLWYLYP